VVSEDEIRAAIAHLLPREKLVVEMNGAPLHTQRRNADLNCSGKDLMQRNAI
jgi:hypothetical protein